MKILWNIILDLCLVTNLKLEALMFSSLHINQSSMFTVIQFKSVCELTIKTASTFTLDFKVIF